MTLHADITALSAVIRWAERYCGVRSIEGLGPFGGYALRTAVTANARRVL